LDAACKLFVSKGYEATGVDEIAAEAGATRGAVYHHFKGKRELLLALARGNSGWARRTKSSTFHGGGKRSLQADPARDRRLPRRLRATRKSAASSSAKPPPCSAGIPGVKIDARHFLG
jgi:AcrR family transcriptional regulator